MVDGWDAVVAHRDILEVEFVAHGFGMVTTSSTSPVPQKVESARVLPARRTSTRRAEFPAAESKFPKMAMSSGSAAFIVKEAEREVAGPADSTEG
jgi:hypothetical protein